MYQRNLIKGLAQLPVALVGIDCKRGVEQSAYAPRLSALATNPDAAASLLDVLVAEMEARFDLLSLHGVSDVWELPEDVRPVPIVVLVDEVAELFLISSRKDEERRERMVTALIRLAQMARAAGIFLEICGQRFGLNSARAQPCSVHSSPAVWCTGSTTSRPLKWVSVTSLRKRSRWSRPIPPDRPGRCGRRGLLRRLVPHPHPDDHAGRSCGRVPRSSPTWSRTCPLSTRSGPIVPAPVVDCSFAGQADPGDRLAH